MRRAPLLAVLALLLLPAITQAATITVTTTADENNSDGDCSLREATIAANTNTTVDGCAAGSGGSDTIMVPAGTYALTLTSGVDSGDLSIFTNVDVVGAGAATTTIDASAVDERVLDIGGGTVSLSGVTLTGGAAASQNGGGIAFAGAGLTLTDCVVTDNTALGVAGIFMNGGALTLTRVIVSDNLTTNGTGGGIGLLGATATITDSTLSGNGGTGVLGGGLFAGGGMGVSLPVDIVRSTLSGNTASNGGAIFAGNDALVTVRNSTISGNISTGNGGALSASLSDGVVFSNCTIVGNTSTNGPGGISASDPVVVRNTVVAGNTSPNGDPDCAATLTSQGYNLIGDLTGCTFAPTTGDQTGVDPDLGPLADNGGPTLTHLPLAGSLVLDAGNPVAPGSTSSACETTDQRSQTRPAGSACDIGAVEGSVMAPTTTTTTSSTSTTTSTSTSTTTTTLPPLCAGGVTLGSASVTARKIGGSAGNERLALRATLPLPAGTPATLDPTASGLQILVTDTGNGSAWLDLTAATAAIPPGARGSGCGSKDGWKGLAYVNKSGALDPPTCTAGSARGLTSVKLKDKRAKGKGIIVVVNAKGASLPAPAGSLAVTVTLGANADAGLSGACGSVTFASCTLKGTTLRCR